MPPTSGADDHAQRILDVVNWHVLRSDGLRGNVSSRAATVLSTNALIVAGIALAFGLRDQHPDALEIGAAAAAFAATTCSAWYAAQALITLRAQSRLFRDDESAFLYAYAEVESVPGELEEFRARIRRLTPAQQLEYATVELWRISKLHSYRYQKLRRAVWGLLIALGCLLVTVAASLLR